MKTLLKSLAYHSGALGALHRWRNRGALTVAMFHRVLPATDPRYPGADPEWTMTDETFAACLAFFQRHYRIVTPQQVFAAMRGEAALPGRALLVTFDDGWADTAEFAQPLLTRMRVPALVFVAGCAIDSRVAFWEEQLYSLLATRAEAVTALHGALARHGIAAQLPPGQGEAAIRAAIALLGSQPVAVRAALVAELTGELAQDPVQPAPMMTQAQLRAMAAAGIAIGGHGMAHVPLTRAPDLEAELGEAQQCIARHLAVERIESMSFPHGARSGAVEQACHAAGYRYLFSSVAKLVRLAPGRPAAEPLARIHISERAIRAADGKVDPAALATWLFLRPVQMAGAQHA